VIEHARYCHNCSTEKVDDGGPDGCVCDMCGCLTNIPLTKEVLLDRIYSLFKKNAEFEVEVSALQSELAALKPPFIQLMKRLRAVAGGDDPESRYTWVRTRIPLVLWHQLRNLYEATFPPVDNSWLDEVNKEEEPKLAKSVPIPEKIILVVENEDPAPQADIRGTLFDVPSWTMPTAAQVPVLDKPVPIPPATIPLAIPAEYLCGCTAPNRTPNPDCPKCNGWGLKS